MSHSISPEFLRTTPLFQYLTDAELILLAEHTNVVYYKKNEEIYPLGIESKFVYVVKKGNVKLGITSNNDKALTKEIAYEEDILCENVFSKNPITQECAETLTETMLYAIPISIFKQLATSNAEFANQLMLIILNKLQNIESRLQSFVFRKAKERIVDYLFRTGQQRGIKIGISECLISQGITHKEIALLTDTSRQTVARIMNELKRNNFIHYGSRKSSKILIRNLALLENYVE